MVDFERRERTRRGIADSNWNRVREESEELLEPEAMLSNLPSPNRAI
ncbi:MAG: hypothetical protein H6674_04440 [Dehalococcoidia bacterium]|nr:hypothetical protein [Dehalococcoidia bacterium]MCB9491300.1 hypothetical protein [Dehalococcoidia bacterium]